jgi:hypothetical protein
MGGPPASGRSASRSIATPMRPQPSAATGSARYQGTPSTTISVQPMYAPQVNTEPWAKLIRLATPKISAKPIAINA